MAESLTFRVADFEGPLDLILTLISKHKLNIYDIEIAVLVEQYMLAIEEMQETADLTSEFLEMAAHLVLIKSRELLPKHDEADALKQELTGQLLEYQICKEMAGKLAAKNVMFDFFVRAQAEIETDMTYRRSHQKEELLAAYFSVVGKSARRLPPPKEIFAPLVEKRVVSVRSRIVRILDHLYRFENEKLETLYAMAEDRSELVATFLAVLELMKGNRIFVSDNAEVRLQKQDLSREEMLALYAGDGSSEQDENQTNSEEPNKNEEE